MLGFDPTEIVSNHPCVETVVESSLVADSCAHYRVVFLYTETVESQTVGDVFAPLLRIVNVTGSDVEMVCIRYDRPYYIPLSRKRIDTIEVVIRTHRVFLNDRKQAESAQHQNLILLLLTDEDAGFETLPIDYIASEKTFLACPQLPFCQLTPRTRHLIPNTKCAYFGYDIGATIDFDRIKYP
ncbi:hypothetical protein AVEN_111811-1 [Araneus ventricosus]|uniref:Uncharacterized protein n=1 Tax=Araneus ventricosus TaxID=182803 RepID=A0A4Y2JHS3_ARAVE|nr:hypothetical protein AVEN_111811-1 [Araneus ventricosus]